MTRRAVQIGDEIVSRPNRRFIEGRVIELSYDRDGEISYVKISRRGWFGNEIREWVWSFDLKFLEPPTSKP